MTPLLRFPLLAFACLTAAATSAANAPNTKAWPLWNGEETVAHYAARAELPRTKALDFGDGVTLDLVLIPAGKFIMGTPEPKPVDEVAFQKRIQTGQRVLGIGAGSLLVLIGGMVVRAIRQRRRPQYSLALFLLMIGCASVSLLGGTRWHQSKQALAQAHTDYKAAMFRFQYAIPSEKPGHEVTLTQPYYIGKFEVMQQQYEQVMGTNPSSFKGVSLPVESVSWNEAVDFCKKASKKTGQCVRLPTEAEREHACRAGTTTTYYSGDAEDDLGRAAWYNANSSGRIHPVGQKDANTFDLHDMYGNVWEWCQDWYDLHQPGTSVDPQGPSEGEHRVRRGGSWLDDAGNCRSASRFRGDPTLHLNDVGFRIVVNPKTP
ncbi:MAG TPA: formylglycine-generating enzyme family protein [Planctomycetota bacterium]|jgi:hypothetical protein